jgi:hypothetical protein
MQTLNKIGLAAMLLVTGAAQAVVVQIDSQQNGSYVAGGPLNLLPGTVAQPFNPVQLTLDAGTYVITNASSSGYFSAWNFNGSGLGSGSNWVWGFLMAAHGGNIIEDAYTGDVLGSQAAVAGATGTTTWNGNAQLAATSTAGFTDTFTLAQTTTLDFYVDDYNWGLGDNYGGVAIDISPVPEADSAALMGLGLLAGAALRRRLR